MTSAVQNKFLTQLVLADVPSLEEENTSSLTTRMPSEFVVVLLPCTCNCWLDLKDG